MQSRVSCLRPFLLCTVSQGQPSDATIRVVMRRRMGRDESMSRIFEGVEAVERLGCRRRQRGEKAAQYFSRGDESVSLHSRSASSQQTECRRSAALLLSAKTAANDDHPRSSRIEVIRHHLVLSFTPWIISRPALLNAECRVLGQDEMRYCDNHLSCCRRLLGFMLPEAYPVVPAGPAHTKQFRHICLLTASEVHSQSLVFPPAAGVRHRAYPASENSSRQFPSFFCASPSPSLIMRHSRHCNLWQSAHHIGRVAVR
nr:hypothetical protein CFP56_62118 [Quercus suber]